jgi:hypothetical protein
VRAKRTFFNNVFEDVQNLRKVRCSSIRAKSLLIITFSRPSIPISSRLMLCQKAVRNTKN